MSALLLSALAAGSSGQGALYVDDVFSTYLYTGNGSTQTINNGIDLAGKGGLVWVKRRDTGGQLHTLVDTARGAGWDLNSSNTAAQSFDSTSLTSFGSSGFSVGSSPGHNGAGGSLVSWTFRRSPKFFDVVTYTGNSTSGRTISHSLGQTPGMIIVKSTTGGTAGYAWVVWHRSLSGSNILYLNTTDAQSSNQYFVTAVSDTSFTLASSQMANLTGDSYVAYLFAHDPSAEGIIQCGSFTTDVSGNATVNSGWANGSQFAMIKAASTTGDWEMYDTARTSAWSGNDARLRANLSNAEDSVARISASGTSITFAGLSANSTYIYMIVRSPS